MTLYILASYLANYNSKHEKFQVLLLTSTCNKGIYNHIHKRMQWLAICKWHYWLSSCGHEICKHDVSASREGAVLICALMECSTRCSHLASFRNVWSSADINVRLGYPCLAFITSKTIRHLSNFNIFKMDFSSP